MPSFGNFFLSGILKYIKMPKGVATTNPTAEEKNARELFQINHKIFKTLAVFLNEYDFLPPFPFSHFPVLIFYKLRCRFGKVCESSKRRKNACNYRNFDSSA